MLHSKVDLRLDFKKVQKMQTKCEEKKTGAFDTLQFHLTIQSRVHL